MPSQSLAVAVLLAATLTACVKPSPRSADPNANFSDGTKGDVNQPAATFFHKAVTLKASNVSKNVEGFSIPIEKQYTFEACLQDKRTQETIKGHKFNIVGAPNLISIANNGRSDEAGCVNWTEKISYNGAADAKYIPLKRSIVADGMHVGARDLFICVNPWDSTGDAVRDCARSPVPDEQLVKQDEVSNFLKGLNKTGEALTHPLWVNDMRLNSTYDPGGAEPGMIDFSVSMNPKILRKNVRGEEDLLSLADGVFNVQFWILAKTGSGSLNNQCIVLANSNKSGDVKMVAGSLQDELRMKVRYLSTYGQLELVGQIMPKDSSLGIAPYNGVWMLGDHTGLLGMKFAFSRPLSYKGTPGSFNAKKYVESCVDVADGAILESPLSSVKISPPVNGAVTVDLGIKHVVNGKLVSVKGKVPADLMTNECVDAKDLPRLFPNDPVAKDFKPGSDFLSCANKNLPSGITRLEQFEFGWAQVKPEPIVDPLEIETTTERTIKYRVTLRVTNPLAQSTPLRDIDFTIEKSDGSKPDPVRTNHLGELIFTDSVHHTYFAPERYIVKIVRIRHASGFTKRLAVILNPWDNNGFTFGRDIRELMKQTIAQVNLIPRPKSELLLTQFQWGTQGFRYEVDDFLNLKIFKQFNLTLNPRVLRYSSMTEGRNKDEPLRAGIYLMKVALQKDYKVLDGEPLEYITVVRKLVRVRNGVINEPVEMAFRDFRILKIRSNLMVELATIDESKLKEEERRTLVVDRDLDSLVAKDSGLAPRTFVGPVVAYSNGFSASMRPADDLAENVCATIDCDEIKKKQLHDIYEGMKKQAEEKPSKDADVALAFYKRSYEAVRDDNRTAEQKKHEKQERDKFVGDIRHLANKSVSDMILREQEIEKAFHEQTAANASLSNLLSAGNYEYGAAFNEPLILKQDPKLLKNNTVLKTGSGFADFVTRLSRPHSTLRQSVDSSDSAKIDKIYTQMAPKPQLDVQTFKNVLFAGQPLTQDIAARLCLTMIEDIVLQRNAKSEESYGYFDRVKARSSRTMLNDECIRAVWRATNSSQLDNVISLERKFRVFQVAGSERRGGNLMGLNVSAGSSHGVGKSQSFSYGWSPVGAAGGAIKVAATKIPGIGILEKFIDATGFSFGMSRSSGQSMGEDTSTGTGQNLAVELRGMRVQLSQYERCASIRLSKDFVETWFPVFRSAFPTNLDLEQRLNRLSRGVLLCEGAILRKSIEVDERYYQFSQVLGDEVMNDPTALENHPYLSMTVRSRGDYSRFIRAIEAKPQGLEQIPDHYDIGELPMQRLRAAFKTSTPTFPGVYTVEPDSIANAEPMRAATSSAIPAAVKTQMSKLAAPKPAN